MMLQISELMRKLASERQLFHSEADFQHAFAWEAHNRLPDAFVRLEYRFPVEAKILHLDLWMTQGEEALAVELKYKTRGLSTVVNGEKYQLTNHSAQDCGRYDFLKDVQRLEQVVSARRKAVGCAILLTNDSSYWSEPNSGRTIDADFRLPHGRTIHGTLRWSDEASPGTTRDRETPISLAGKYCVQWCEFSGLQSNRLGRFQYLAVLVPGR